MGFSAPPSKGATPRRRGGGGTRGRKAGARGGRRVSTVTAISGAFDATDAPSMDGLRTCVHCGICLPQCPTYRVLGQEMDSPRGRIYLMRAAAEGRIGLTPVLARHLDLCLGCRGCETACPSGVPFGQLLEATRGQLARRGVRAPATDHRALG